MSKAGTTCCSELQIPFWKRIRYESGDLCVLFSFFVTRFQFISNDQISEVSWLEANDCGSCPIRWVSVVVFFFDFLFVFFYFITPRSVRIPVKRDVWIVSTLRTQCVKISFALLSIVWMDGFMALWRVDLIDFLIDTSRTDRHRWRRQQTWSSSPNSSKNRFDGPLWMLYQSVLDLSCHLESIDELNKACLGMHWAPCCFLKVHAVWLQEQEQGIDLCHPRTTTGERNRQPSLSQKQVSNRSRILRFELHRTRL